MTLYKSSRGYLPTIDPPNQVLMVTFRLQGSLPSHVLKSYQAEALELPKNERRRAVNVKIENYLDAGRDVRHLANPEVACQLQSSLKHFHGDRYKLYAWVVMSNHVHLLLALLGEWRLGQVIGSLKKYTARQANEILGRRGPLWSRDQYDTVIRNEDHFRRAVWYIHANPVKVGICDKPEDFQWSSAHDGWSFKKSIQGNW